MARRGSRGGGGTKGLIDGAIGGAVIFGIIKIVDIVAGKVGVDIPS